MSDIIPENTPQKQCIQCEEFFPATTDFFPPDRERLKPRCRTCNSARYKKYREEHQDQINARMKQWHAVNKEHDRIYGQQRADLHVVYRELHEGKIKICQGCKKSLPSTTAYFHKSSHQVDGWHPFCKKCRPGHKGRTFGITPPACQEGEKYCMQCLRVLPATSAYFHKAGRGKYELSSRCKQCRGKGRTFGRETIKHSKHEKRCQECLKVFPKTPQYFNRTRSSHNDGFNSICKTCRKILHQQNKEEINQQRREKRRSSPDLFREKDKMRYRKHRESMRLKSHRLYMKHREKRRIYAEQYRISHYTEHNTYMRNRNALKKAIPGSHTPQEIRDLYRRQKGNCYYCCHKVPWGKHHVDHTFPISRVIGTDIPANDISYLVITCPTCNLRKGNKFPWEFPEGGRLL